MSLPKAYEWLEKETGPKILLEALATYGTKEKLGSQSNPVILGWAKEVKAAGYNTDSIPWCALGMAVWAHRAGYAPPEHLLAAISWLSFGDHVDVADIKLGDVLVFKRKGGHHVGLYVGEATAYYSILGANQNDSVCFEMKSKATLVGARRCHWKIAQPANVRKILLTASGPVDAKED